jgi:hypothetical protein
VALLEFCKPAAKWIEDYQRSVADRRTTKGQGKDLTLEYLPGRLDVAEQVKLLGAIRVVLAEAPLFTPAMPRSGGSGG